MELIVFDDKQRQENLPVPFEFEKPKLIKIVSHAVYKYRLNNYIRRANAKKGFIVDVQV